MVGLGRGHLRQVEQTPDRTGADPRHVWSLLVDGVSASRVAGTVLVEDLIVLDVDATIVVSNSEKEQAALTFQRTFGFHPLGV